MKFTNVIAIILVVLTASLVGCSLFDQRENVEFENFSPYDRFYFSEAGTTIIRDNETYQELWETGWGTYGEDGLKTPLPEVDFAIHMLIFIHYGYFSKGAMHHIEVVESVETDGEKIFVTLSEMPTLQAWAAPSSPFQVIKIEQTNMEIEFEGSLP